MVRYKTQKGFMYLNISINALKVKGQLFVIRHICAFITRQGKEVWSSIFVKQDKVMLSSLCPLILKEFAKMRLSYSKSAPATQKFVMTNQRTYCTMWRLLQLDISLPVTHMVIVAHQCAMWVTCLVVISCFQNPILSPISV